MVGDRLALSIESSVTGEIPLLERVMHNGERLLAPEKLDAIAQRTAASVRSEEHTSELQSRQYLVCRLLLEKKKKKQKITY